MSRGERGARDRQLVFEWTDPMQWADVPADSREQLRELLGALLHQAAAPGGARGEGGSNE